MWLPKCVRSKLRSPGRIMYTPNFDDSVRIANTHYLVISLPVTYWNGNRSDILSETQCIILISLVSLHSLKCDWRPFRYGCGSFLWLTLYFRWRALVYRVQLSLLWVHPIKTGNLKAPAYFFSGATRTSASMEEWGCVRLRCLPSLHPPQLLDATRDKRTSPACPSQDVSLSFVVAHYSFSVSSPQS